MVKSLLELIELIWSQMLHAKINNMRSSRTVTLEFLIYVAD